MWIRDLLVVGAVGVATQASAGIIFTASGPSGLGAEAEFTMIDPTTLEVRLKNTSTGVPAWFSNSDQILTGVSWDFGPAGPEADTEITGGSVRTGPASSSVNFDVMNVGPNEDVTGEYGYGNRMATMTLPNFVSAHTANATPFGGTNLDQSEQISGPQGGLVPSPGPFVPIGGLGAIRDEVIATLTLSDPITQEELEGYIRRSGVIFEFGSDAAFIPAPAAAGSLSGFLALLVVRRRRIER